MIQLFHSKVKGAKTECALSLQFLHFQTSIFFFSFFISNGFIFNRYIAPCGGFLQRLFFEGEMENNSCIEFN
jgi:hypothetical protein